MNSFKQILSNYILLLSPDGYEWYQYNNLCLPERTSHKESGLSWMNVVSRTAKVF
ncbi:MAG: hypothetical protein U0Y96_05475 [Candidatus Kapaibacterium sp.]|nr:hypothetical protein [Bacteroidota bacterium]